MEQVIVGQRYMLERLLVGLLANGHVLIEGSRHRPGPRGDLARPGLARGLPEIRFHPGPLARRPDRHADLPAPIGRVPRAQGAGVRGLLLADEINRAPAKVLSALLEAVGEPGHDRRRDHRLPSRSWCSRPRTRSTRRRLSARARSTASCSSSGSPTRIARRSSNCRPHGADHAARDPPGRRHRSGDRARRQGRRGLSRRQDQALHRRSGVRHPRGPTSTAWTSASTSSWRVAAPRSLSLVRQGVFPTGRDYVNPRTSSRSGWTCCAAACSHDLRGRSRRHRERRADSEGVRQRSRA